jgi:hypothetical protein
MLWMRQTEDRHFGTIVRESPVLFHCNAHATSTRCTIALGGRMQSGCVASELVDETIVPKPHHSFDRIRVACLNLTARMAESCLDGILECEDLVATKGRAFLNEQKLVPGLNICESSEFLLIQCTVNTVHCVRTAKRHENLVNIRNENTRSLLVFSRQTKHQNVQANAINCESWMSVSLMNNYGIQSSERYFWFLCSPNRLQ